MGEYTMKKFILVAVLAGALAALLAGSAFAAGPMISGQQGFGPGNGIHAPGTGMGGAGMVGRGAPEWAGQPDEVATLLGMTQAQIQAERQSGKSLVQIASPKGIGEDQLISTILEAKKADLAKLVAAGTLTQAQMDYMVQRMQTQVKVMVERTSVGPAFGQARPGMGQGMRGGRGANR